MSRLYEEQMTNKLALVLIIALLLIGMLIVFGVPSGPLTMSEYR